MNLYATRDSSQADAWLKSTVESFKFDWCTTFKHFIVSACWVQQPRNALVPVTGFGKTSQLPMNKPDHYS